ncbi:MAG: guanylate kinase [Bacilli bacterium]|nr:guanylate kinase [Bacilli bacterium]MDD4733737.1 guanylate kinase [Bacilli bacterium]
MRIKKGNLIVLSGPSGCGKSTISQEIMKDNKNIIESVSMTTRNIRQGEVDGKDYYFLSKEEFEKNIQDGKLLEYALYSDNYYGTPKDNVIQKINQGLDVILVIEIQGALQVKEKFKEAIFIFILPPSIKELKKRLDNRKTETNEQLFKRFQIMYKEINEIKKYNYVVINDILEDAVNNAKSIIAAEKCRVDRIEDEDINSLEEELHEILVQLDEK